MRIIIWLQDLKRNRIIVALLVLMNLILFSQAIQIHMRAYEKTSAWLIPLAPMCDIMDILFAACFAFYFFKKKIPSFLAAVTFFYGISYCLISFVFYPSFISWYGASFGKFGAFFWVVVGGIQAIIISDQIRLLPKYQYAIIGIYFTLKDYFDYTLDNFYYFKVYHPPSWIRRATLLLAPIHLFVFILLMRIGKKADDNAKDKTKDVVKDKAKDLAKDKIKDIVKDKTKDLVKAGPNDKAKNISGDKR